MSNQSYDDAPDADKHHFVDCGVCGEKLDCRDLDEVLQHEDHEPHPDVPYSGSARMPDPIPTSDVILDEGGQCLIIGQRVGCRLDGEPRSASRRGLTLIAYEWGSDKPFITNEGAFAFALPDHSPEMEEWAKRNVLP